MNSRLKSNRSNEVPMDFEFTSRSSVNTKSIWAIEDVDNPHTHRKRTLTDMNPPRPVFPPTTPAAPTFGANTNIPFIFQSPVPRSSHVPPWSPPPAYSVKGFPQPEVSDVDMSELSPPKQEGPAKSSDEDSNRAISIGGMRRVFRSRQARAKSRNRARIDDESSDDEDNQSDTDDKHVVRAKSPITQTTSNHYTLNMPSPSAHRSELPYLLSGYLQFSFNLCLILVFLYLLIHFILTVQRDVEQKVSEYSMEIVQEIANCALMFKTNHCPGNIVPHMVQPCSEWEMCMNRDPTKVGRTRIGAELIAEVLNGFVEPITWKTLGFTLASLSFLTVFINTVFSFYRSKHQPQPASIALPPVQTPYYHPLGAASNWGPSWQPQINTDEDPETPIPSRRRRLEGGAVAKIK